MKFHDLMSDALSEWRPVRNAADLAHEIAAHLDDDERERIFMRGLTNEVRQSLRRKDSTGCPTYSNVDRIDPSTGAKTRIYKQTELFSVDDFKVAVASYLARADENRKVAGALAASCKTRHGVNPMPGKASAA
jgi:hypothetical protein